MSFPFKTRKVQFSILEIQFEKIADLQSPALPSLRCVWIASSSICILHEGGHLPWPSSLSSGKSTLCSSVGIFLLHQWMLVQGQLVAALYRWVLGTYVLILNLCFNAFFLLQMVAGTSWGHGSAGIPPTNTVTTACARAGDGTHIQRHTRSTGLVEITVVTRGTLAFFLERVINEKWMILPY